MESVKIDFVLTIYKRDKTTVSVSLIKSSLFREVL